MREKYDLSESKRKMSLKNLWKQVNEKLKEKKVCNFLFLKPLR